MKKKFVEEVGWSLAYDIYLAARYRRIDTDKAQPSLARLRVAVRSFRFLANAAQRSNCYKLFMKGARRGIASAKR